MNTTKSEVVEESNKMHAAAMSQGFVLRRQPHQSGDTVFDVYYEAVKDERRSYGQGSSWEEAIIDAAKKVLKK